MADAPTPSTRLVLRATQLPLDPSTAAAGYVASRSQASRTRRSRAGAVGTVPRRVPSPWPVVAGLAVLTGLLVLAIAAAHNLNHSSGGGHHPLLSDGSEDPGAPVDGEQYLYASPAEVGVPVVVYRVLDDDTAHARAHRETLSRLGRAMALLCSADARSVAAFDGPGRQHLCQRKLSRVDLDFAAEDAAMPPAGNTTPKEEAAAAGPKMVKSRLLRIDDFLAGFVSRRFHNPDALRRAPFNGTLSNRRPAMIVAASPDDGPSVSALDIASALAAVAAEAAADENQPHRHRGGAVTTVADCTTRGPAHLGRADPFAGDQVALSWAVGGIGGDDDGDDDGNSGETRVVSMGCAVVLPPRSVDGHPTPWSIAPFIEASLADARADLTGAGTVLQKLAAALVAAKTVLMHAEYVALHCAVTLPSEETDAFNLVLRRAVAQVAHRAEHALVSQERAGSSQGSSDDNGPAQLHFAPGTPSALSDAGLRVRSLCRELETGVRSSSTGSMRAGGRAVRSAQLVRQATRADLRRLLTAASGTLRDLTSEAQRTNLGLEGAVVMGALRAQHRGGALRVLPRSNNGGVLGRLSAHRRAAPSMGSPQGSGHMFQGARAIIRVPVAVPRRLIAWSLSCCHCCGFSEEVALMATALDRRYLARTAQEALVHVGTPSAAASPPPPQEAAEASSVFVTAPPTCFCPSQLQNSLSGMYADVQALEDALARLGAEGVGYEHPEGNQAVESGDEAAPSHEAHSMLSGDVLDAPVTPSPAAEAARPRSELVWIGHTDPSSLLSLTWDIANASDAAARTARVLVVRIARTMVEVNRVSEATAQMVTAFAHTVWAPSRYVARVFERAGIRNVDVVPEPVDVSVWRPLAPSPLPPYLPQGGQPTSAGLAADASAEKGYCAALSMRGMLGGKWFSATLDGYVANTSDGVTGRPRPAFVRGADASAAQRCCEAGPARCLVITSQFKWEPRKGWDVLITAAARSVNDTSTAGGGGGGVGGPREVVVVLLTRWFTVLSAEYADPENATRVFESLSRWSVSRDRGLPTGADGRRLTLVVTTARLSETTIAAATRASTLFALPTRGEGWGLPAVQAMASGVPTIVTNATGPLDFVAGAIPLRVCGSVPLVGAFAPYKTVVAHERAVLVEPCVDHLEALIREYGGPGTDSAALRQEAAGRGRSFAVSNFAPSVIADATERAIDRAVTMRRRAWNSGPLT